MTLSAPVQRVVDLLRSAGYRPLAAKTMIASVPFEFDALLVGSERALDLIIVVDTLIEREARSRQKVEGAVHLISSPLGGR